MSLILNQTDWEELCQQLPQHQLNKGVLDDFEKLWGVPELLGRGYSREIELSPGVRLHLSDCEYHQDFSMKTPAHAHPVQFMILSSGSYYNDIYPTFSKVRSYFSGSGVSPGYVEKFQTGQRIVCINVEIESQALESYLSFERQSNSILQKQLLKKQDLKASFYPTVTQEMRSLVQELWNAPYRGAAKQMYVQGKVFELLGLHLDLISPDTRQIKSPPKMRPKTIASLHHARDILTTQFEHPPSLPELAIKVGVSERSLQRGFSTLFETTVVGFIAQQRLERAKMLLREGKHSVAEVALLVGYGNIGHFSVAFRSRFGITPSQCSKGKKANIEQI